MPYLDLHKGLLRVRMVIPLALRPFLDNKTALVRSTGTGNRAEANQIAPPIIAEFQAMLASAEAERRGDEIHHYDHHPSPYHGFSGTRIVRRFGPEPPDDDRFWKSHSRRDGTRPAGAVNPVVEFRPIIDLWAIERKIPPKTKRDYASKHARFFAFLDKGHTDMARIETGDVIRYKEHLLALGRSQVTVENHLTILKGIFSYAHENRKIPTNPTVGIKFNAKKDPREKRQPFSDAERCLILTEARAAEPVIRWANWLASFSGARLAEITEADTRDVEIIEGVPVFHIRLDHRGMNQNVKNEGSLRRFPIHSSVIREGFLDYVRSLPPGPLFPTVRVNGDGKRSPEAGDIIMPWLRSIGITDRRKVFHSHRHTFKSLSRGRIEEEIHDYITGHGNGAVGRDYGLYPVPMLAEAIERIPDPTRSS